MNTIIFFFFSFFVLATDKGYNIHEIAYDGDIDALESLIKEKNEQIINIKDKLGWSPLHHAVVGGQLESVKLLAEQKNINLNTQDHKGRTPLHYAAEGGYFRVVTYLSQLKELVHKIDEDTKAKKLHLDIFTKDWYMAWLVTSRKWKKRLDINIQDHKGRTSLHYAAREGHFKTVKYLVQQAFADTSLQDHKGQKAFDYAEEGGHKKISKFLNRSNKKFTNDQESSFIRNMVQKCKSAFLP